jgi:ATP-dependent DNA ligase
VEPLLIRKSALLSLLRGRAGRHVYSEHLEGDGARIFHHACRVGCERIFTIVMADFVDRRLTQAEE